MNPAQLWETTMDPARAAAAEGADRGRDQLGGNLLDADGRAGRAAARVHRDRTRSACATSTSDRTANARTRRMIRASALVNARSSRVPGVLRHRSRRSQSRWRAPRRTPRMPSRLIVKLKPDGGKSAFTAEGTDREAGASGSRCALRTMAMDADVVAVDRRRDAARALGRKLAAIRTSRSCRSIGVATPAVINDPFAAATVPANAPGSARRPRGTSRTARARSSSPCSTRAYRPHAGMAGRLLPGYDMISDPPTANDGDGRDARCVRPRRLRAASEATDDCGATSARGTGRASPASSAQHERRRLDGRHRLGRADSAGAGARQMRRLRFGHRRRHRVGRGTRRARRARQSDACAGHQPEPRRRRQRVRRSTRW